MDFVKICLTAQRFLRLVGRVSEIITDKHNGLLHKADEATEKVAQDITQIDPEHFVAMRKCARATWEKSFDAEKNYKEFTEDLII